MLFELFGRRFNDLLSALRVLPLTGVGLQFSSEFSTALTISREASSVGSWFKAFIAFSYLSLALLNWTSLVLGIIRPFGARGITNWSLVKLIDPIILLIERMAYSQNIFDVLNMSQSTNGLDPDKRHYQCVENEGLVTCVRTLETSSKGKHVSISKACPEIFDKFTLSYKIGSQVSVKNLNHK